MVDENQISKKKIEELMKIPGEIRGEILLVNLPYIKEKKGEEGIKLFKKKMEEVGVSFDKIEPLKWYPIGFLPLSLLVMKEIFGWNTEEMFNLGNSAFKLGLIPRILSKYFVSLSAVFQMASEHWKKYHSIGELEPYQLNEKEKYIIGRLKNYKIHPLLCSVNKGVFLRIIQYVIKSKKITIEETKCMFKGDPYHEFLIKWD